MEKDALLKIILQDIRELESLVSTFTGKEKIPDAFIRLTKSKTLGILEEIDLLDGLHSTPDTSDNIQEFNTANDTTDNASAIKEEPTPVAPFEQPATEKSVEDTFILENDHNKEKDDQSSTPEKTEPTHSPKQNPTANIIPPPVSAPQPKREPEKTKEEKNNQQSSVIGEILGRDKQSFNERLGQNRENDTMSKFRQPVRDLKKAIGINDRFFYQRELFGNNSELFNQTLDQLNSMDSLDSAKAFLSANFNWDQKNEAVNEFNELVKRRYL